MLEILLIGGLATWSISSLLVHERGPMNLFGRLRLTAGVITNPTLEQSEWWLSEHPGFDESEIPEQFGQTEIGRMLSCLWCTSMWVSFVLAACMWLVGMSSPVMAPIYALAFRAIAIFLDEMIHGQK